MTFRFANLPRRWDIELLLRVCGLDEVVLLVHCCVLQISDFLHPRYSAIPSIMQNTSVSNNSSHVVNFQHYGCRKRCPMDVVSVKSDPHLPALFPGQVCNNNEWFVDLEP